MSVVVVYFHTHFCSIHLFVFPSLEIGEHDLDRNMLSRVANGGGGTLSTGGLKSGIAVRLTTWGDLFMNVREFLSWLCEGAEALICLVNAANPAPGDRPGSACCNAFQAAVKGRRKLFLLMCF